jgi:hypothetical protein
MIIFLYFLLNIKACKGRINLGTKVVKRKNNNNNNEELSDKRRWLLC